MKNYLFVFFVLSSCICLADDRLRMEEFPESEREIKKLVESVCEATNNQDKKEFLNCFTKKKASSLRKKINFVFQKPLEMSVVEYDIVFENKNKIEFDFVYFWNYTTDPKQLVTTKVVAKKENGIWKIEDSKISKVETQGMPGNCAGGQCINMGNNRFAGNNQFNVDLNDGLPQDIGRHNMGACPGGRCNVPR
jgi:hypothetical protein